MCCILMSGLLKLQTRSRCVQKELALWWQRLDDVAESGPWSSVWSLVSRFSSCICDCCRNSSVKDPFELVLSLECGRCFNSTMESLVLYNSRNTLIN